MPIKQSTTHAGGSIHELLNKFRDGKGRYTKSTLFRNTIDAIYFGEDPLNIIDNLIEMNDNCRYEMQEIIKKANFNP